jgi:hypothetical protein
MPHLKNIALLLFCTLGLLYLKDDVRVLLSPSATWTETNTTSPHSSLTIQPVQLPTHPEEQLTLTATIVSASLTNTSSFLLLDTPNAGYIFATSQSRNLSQLIRDGQIPPGTSAQLTLKQDPDPIPNPPEIVRMYLAKGPYKITAVKIPSPPNPSLP